MKKQIIILLFISLILFSSQPSNSASALDPVPLHKIAIIIDSQEFYHSSFVDDILEGVSAINTTFQIDYDVFRLTNYNLVSTNPYQVSYVYNDTVTNHTRLIEDELIPKNEYDLFVIIGYELRRDFLDFVEFSEYNFLFYDLSGEYPAFSPDTIPDNLYIISFQDHEEAFLAGSLAVAKFDLPEKIAIVGTYQGDSRSRRLIAGFQSAIFRHSTSVDILITYIDTWVDSEKVKNIASDLNNQDYRLAFSALQANNTLELKNAFTSGDLVCVDLNSTFNVMKNNSRVLYEVFENFNTSGGFSGGGSVTYGLSDNIFHANGWGDASMVNKTITELIDEVTSKELVIPSEIVYASNTPGYSFLIVIISITGLMIIRSKRLRKDN